MTAPNITFTEILDVPTAKLLSLALDALDNEASGAIGQLLIEENVFETLDPIDNDDVNDIHVFFDTIRAAIDAKAGF